MLGVDGRVLASKWLGSRGGAWPVSVALPEAVGPGNPVQRCINCEKWVALLQGQLMLTVQLVLLCSVLLAIF